MTTNPNPPTAPAGRSPVLDLPPGSVLIETIDGPWHEPLLWYADQAADRRTWARLLPAREAAGLQPVLLQGGEGEEELWGGMLAPGMMSDPGSHDAEEVLASFWADVLPGLDDEEDGETIAPFGRAWPGLAPGRAFEADPDSIAAEVAASLIEDGWLSGPRAGLVPARRGADIAAAIGWTGPLNHENDVARLCAVLRSWEDRFGIRVVALAFDRLHLSVAAPPRTPEEALAVAAEHFAFCPDTIWQGYDTIHRYADEALPGNHHWTFWWD